DFDLGRPDRERAKLALQRFVMRGADQVVVQTHHQLELARRAFPELNGVVRIASFAEGAEVSPREPEAFLWANRLVAYKHPEAYVELAEALPEARFRMVGIITSETPKGLVESLEAAHER